MLFSVSGKSCMCIWVCTVCGDKGVWKVNKNKCYNSNNKLGMRSFFFCMTNISVFLSRKFQYVYKIKMNDMVIQNVTWICNFSTIFRKTLSLYTYINQSISWGSLRTNVCTVFFFISYRFEQWLMEPYTYISSPGSNNVCVRTYDCICVCHGYNQLRLQTSFFHSHSFFTHHKSH